MKTKHTQSNWHYGRTHAGEYAVFSKTCQVATSELLLNHEEQKANTVLIAAAPEMLKVLTDYVHSLLPTGEVEKWYSQYKNDSEANTILVNAITVIKKATEVIKPTY